MEKRSKVLLADASEDFRRLLQEAIERTDEFAVIGSVGDGAEALRLAEEQSPDLILMDIVLPGLDGMTLLRRLPEKDRPKVISSRRSTATRPYRRP